MKSLGYLLTLVLLVMLSACTGKKTGSKESAYEKVYREALNARDYKTATFALTAMASEEKPDTWVFDSLALYHYLYNQDLGAIAAGALPELSAAKYYVNKGLAINPGNTLLLQLRGQIMVSESDTGLKAAQSVFETMASRYNDVTGNYLLIVSNILSQNPEMIKKASDMLETALKDQQRATQKVLLLEPKTRSSRFINYHTALLMIKAQTSKTEAEALSYLDEIIKTDPSYKEAGQMREALINKRPLQGQAQPQR